MVSVVGRVEFAAGPTGDVAGAVGGRRQSGHGVVVVVASLVVGQQVLEVVQDEEQALRTEVGDYPLAGRPIADIRQDAIDAALASLDNREVMGVRLDVMDRAGFAAAAAGLRAVTCSRTIRASGRVASTPSSPWRGSYVSCASSLRRVSRRSGSMLLRSPPASSSTGRLIGSPGSCRPVSASWARLRSTFR